MEIWIWTIIIAVSLIVESATNDMVCVWFACGALVGLILAGIGVPLTWQIVAFALVSIILLLSLRRWVKGFLSKDTIATNSDMLKGQKTHLEKAIEDGEAGMLSINGICWGCISNNGKSIEKGEIVEIIKIKGNKLVVKKEND